MNEEVNGEAENKPSQKKSIKRGGPEDKNKTGRYPVLSGFAPPETSKDPLLVLKKIIKDKGIDENGRAWLLEYTVTRFTNRRRMAYLSLYAILISLALLFIISIIDGKSSCIVKNECTGILKSLGERQGLLSWIEGFLASIVAAYYGMSSFRPSS